MQAEMEYRKLLRSGEYSANDLRSYGILHQYMMQVCREQAETMFDRVLRKGPEDDPEIYWSTRRQKAYFLWELGRNQENIAEFLPLAEEGSDELQVWICLIQAYSFAEDYDAALKWICRAENKFPESAILHIYSGDLLRSMRRYEEAFRHWNRALEMEPDWCDAAYSMASCYEELGDYEKASATYTQIADNLERRGFESEVSLPRTLAQKCLEKISS